jgi:hypothetical protein
MFDNFCLWFAHQVKGLKGQPSSKIQLNKDNFDFRNLVQFL